MSVNPAQISTKLLNAEDKQDMLDGKLSIEELIVHVKVWVQNGMPDYVNNQNNG